jgi:hypothetical protein
MKDLNANIDSLAGFAHEQKLVARAFDACSVFLNNEAQENGLPHQLNPADVKIRFRSHSLTFESNLLPYPYISTQLDLCVGDEEVGWYKLVVRLDGQNENDYLVFYPEWKS